MHGSMQLRIKHLEEENAELHKEIEKIKSDNAEWTQKTRLMYEQDMTHLHHQLTVLRQPVTEGMMAEAHTRAERNYGQPATHAALATEINKLLEREPDEKSG